MCSAGLLHGVLDKGAGLGVWQGCWSECLAGKQDCVFDRDARLSVGHGCWIESLTDMLD